jgi:predicted GIY-YIG superfamily endonuclease
LLGQTSPTIETVVAKSFAEVHGGWSCDEVLLDDERNKQFLAACRRSLPDTDSARFNWTLLTLRKAGKLNATTRHRRSDDHSACQHAAEIAARLMEDKYSMNIDRVMCNPDLRREFDDVTRSLAPSVDSYLLRKAAFALRKARQLRPELVVRIADWGRVISVHSLASLQSSLENITTSPGVYIFRDSSGYLYIGESHNLRDRLGQHLDTRQPSSLLNLLATKGVDFDKVQIELHAFDPHSAAKQARMRRAYESELIESRAPKFNVRP